MLRVLGRNCIGWTAPISPLGCPSGPYSTAQLTAGVPYSSLADLLPQPLPLTLALLLRQPLLLLLLHNTRERELAGVGHKVMSAGTGTPQRVCANRKSRRA